MAAKTGIEWTDLTWNPTPGCDVVSEGCENCYARPAAARLKLMGSHRYQVDGDPATSGPGFGAHEWPQALEWGELRKTDPKRVFVNSMGDLFHHAISSRFIAQVWAVMSIYDQHVYQVLTKRHARMRAVLTHPAFKIAVNAERMRRGYTVLPDSRQADGTYAWPLRNVWGGVSVENQRWAEIRVPYLLMTPLAVRIVSTEPLLGHVYYTRLDMGSYWIDALTGQRGNNAGHDMPPTTRLDWVIAGGESGPAARPMHPSWPRLIRDQCAAADVPFLFKQWGGWAEVAGSDDWRNRVPTDEQVRADGYHWPISQPHGAEDDTEVLMRKVGKKAAGRLLDGRTHDQYPAQPNLTPA